MAHGHLHQVLQDCNLLEYEPLLLEEGADDVSQLKELDEEEFRQLCLMVGMASKPFHVKRFQKALSRPSSQVLSAKLMSRTAVSAPAKVTQVQPPLIGSATPVAPILRPGLNRSVAMTPGMIQAKSMQQPGSSASTSLIHNLSLSNNYYQQQHQKSQVQRSKVTQTRTSSSAKSTLPYSLSSKEAPEMSSSSTSSSSSVVSYHQPREQVISSEEVHLASKHPFLPPYLQPDSDAKDLSCLVDDQTPIQAELGPCPFKPSDWDERRTDLVRRYSAIYGQGGGSKRKTKELLLHEESINSAAFQLCLRDPTLLVRRDELLILSRKAIKDGGYIFQHGLSKSKMASSTTSSESNPLTSSNSILKNQAELMPLDDGASPRFVAPAGLLPLPRNMSREKKLKRVEELEFLIAKNKTKQSLKLASLEKARQANDFSMSHHLQAEIESLGSTLAALQDEYSNMKYRLRRSDRYFEKKRKMEDASDGTIVGQSLHLSSSAAAAEDLILEVVPKRHHTATDSNYSGTAGNFYSSLHNEELRGSAEEDDSASMDDNSIHTRGETSSSDTTVTYSRSLLKTMPISSTLPNSSPSSTSLSLHYSSSLSNAYRDTSVSSAPKSEGNSPNDNTECSPTTTGNSSHKKSNISREKIESSQDLEEEELPATQLLESINKLATQAAENLRSLPHF